MNPEQPGQPDPDVTIRRRWPQQPTGPHPAPPSGPYPAPLAGPPPRPNPGPHPGPQPYGGGPVPPHRQDDPPGSFTRRLPYTPDMLPDVPVYEAKAAKSGWWWMILVCGVALLAAALTAGFLFWVNGGA
ncbi:hypothetical protein [Nonomuraea sp. NPDC023979]|uniref:hypothetical protein n=1 Tax=Nonomuraea sp. NPDC023979 TaxID=3154796 RepID=UPI00340E096B